MKNLVNAVAILKVKKHPRTIDALIKWIERRLFHDEFNMPTEKDLHIWLKHAKKFKREQNKLKRQVERLRKIEDASLILFADTIEFYKKPYNKPKGAHLEFSRKKQGNDLWRLWKTLEAGDDDETKNDIPPKE